MFPYLPKVQTLLGGLVFEPERGILLVEDEDLGGLTLALTVRLPQDVDDAAAAKRGLAELLGQPLPQAEVKPLIYVPIPEPGELGRSPRYEIRAFDIDLHHRVHLNRLPPRFTFLTLDQMLAEKTVTLPTREVARHLKSRQQVSLAALVRRTWKGRQFFMTRNVPYGGFFLPASRLKTDGSARYEALEAFRRETGFRPRVVAEHDPEVVTDEHYSRRFEATRRFLFHVVPVTVPSVPDLNARHNVLETRLELSGDFTRSRWVDDEELDDPEWNGLSPTVTAVRDALRRL